MKADCEPSKLAERVRLVAVAQAPKSMGYGPGVSYEMATMASRVGREGKLSSSREAYGLLASKPNIDTFAVVISVGHRTSVRPVATAAFCTPWS